VKAQGSRLEADRKREKGKGKKVKGARRKDKG